MQHTDLRKTQCMGTNAQLRLFPKSTESYCKALTCPCNAQYQVTMGKCISCHKGFHTVQKHAPSCLSSMTWPFKHSLQFLGRRQDCPPLTDPDQSIQNHPGVYVFAMHCVGSTHDTQYSKLIQNTHTHTSFSRRWIPNTLGVSDKTQAPLPTRHSPSHNISNNCTMNAVTPLAQALYTHTLQYIDIPYNAEMCPQIQTSHATRRITSQHICS